MYMRVIRAQIQSGKLEEFARRWHKEIIPKIHAFHDVRHVYLGADREQNKVSSVTLFETPADEATLEQWVREFVEHIRDLIQEGPEVTYYEVIEDVS